MGGREEKVSPNDRFPPSHAWFLNDLPSSGGRSPDAWFQPATTGAELSFYTSFQIVRGGTSYAVLPSYR